MTETVPKTGSRLSPFLPQSPIRLRLTLLLIRSCFDVYFLSPARVETRSSKNCRSRSITERDGRVSDICIRATIYTCQNYGARQKERSGAEAACARARRHVNLSRGQFIRGVRMREIPPDFPVFLFAVFSFSSPFLTFPHVPYAPCYARLFIFS